jgi:hypothetical protein
MRLDEPEGGLWIELLHHDHRPARPVHAHAEAQRRGMIERRRREIDDLLVEAVEFPDHAASAVSASKGLAALFAGRIGGASP